MTVVRNSSLIFDFLAIANRQLQTDTSNLEYHMYPTLIYTVYYLKRRLQINSYKYEVGFLTKILYAFHPHACYMFCPTIFPSIDHLNNIL
jgi:hypothetical protein